MRNTAHRVSRRAVMSGAGAVAMLGALPQSAHSSSPGHGERLWYTRPAASWDEALPVGNGRLGAMVFGRVKQERLQLNEDTLWAGGPYSPANPKANSALPNVRRLLSEGKYKDATELASADMMAKPLWQMSYGTLGDILLTFDDALVPTGYERELDLRTAVSTTRYHTSRGRYTREVFASAPDQVIVMHLKGPKGALSFDLDWRAPRKTQYTSPDYAGSATKLSTASETNWLQHEIAGSKPDTVTFSADGSNAVLCTGRNEDGPDTPGKLTYAIRIKALTDGRMTTEGDKLVVRDASNVTLIIAAATSYVKFDDVSGDPVGIVVKRTEDAGAKAYNILRQSHVREYQSLYGTMSLSLGGERTATLPTETRISTAETSDDPALAALYLAYGRYLMISSSRPGTQPANLQGIWNEGINPPWGSKYTININTEMNYWPADPAGLSVCVEPLLRMVEDLAITGTATAKTMYGARGWVTHHNTDLWRATAPIDGPMWGMWPCGGAWLCNTLWDHFDYTQDMAVLNRLYPLMRDASLFFLDTLIEDPKGRGLVTSPSISPENQHPFGSSLAIGPAMDRQIVRDLLGYTVSAGKRLKQDEALLQTLAYTQVRIAPDRIGSGGQLQEWLEDWDAAAPELHHRHVSHLYGIYPSSQINVRDTPALIAAAKTSLENRGDLATGWGTAWRLCLWARMGDGERAHGILKALLGPQRTYPNMFDAHPPFQIDGNFGGAAGILEMLVQSWGGEVRILPALPTSWPSGQIKGLRARGGLSVDLTWAKGRAQHLKINGPPHTVVNVRMDGKLRQVTLDKNGQFNFKT